MFLRKKQSLIDRKTKYHVIDLEDPNQANLPGIAVYKSVYRDNPEKMKLIEENKYFVYISSEDDDPGVGSPFYFYRSKKDLLDNFTGFEMFRKNSRSTWRYWFAHWCAFQMTAINLGMWKFKYLFHDIEKPFMLSLLSDYSKVQRKHRENNRHHTEYGLIHGWDKMDWEAAVIDWECSRFSKMDAQMNARETMEKLVQKPKWKPYEDIIRKNIEPILWNHFL